MKVPKVELSGATHRQRWACPSQPFILNHLQATRACSYSPSLHNTTTSASTYVISTERQHFTLRKLPATHRTSTMAEQPNISQILAALGGCFATSYVPVDCSLLTPVFLSRSATWRNAHSIATTTAATPPPGLSWRVPVDNTSYWRCGIPFTTAKYFWKSRPQQYQTDQLRVC